MLKTINYSNIYYPTKLSLCSLNFNSSLNLSILIEKKTICDIDFDENNQTEKRNKKSIVENVKTV